MLAYHGFYTQERFHSILSEMSERGCCDLYLIPYNPPIVRDPSDHKLYEINLYFEERYPILTPEDINNIISLITKKEHLGRRELDTSYSLEDKAYFRVHIASILGNLGIIMRNIPARIPSLEDLSFSPEVLERLKLVVSTHKDGLVLVTGPTGSGKSTTLAAMIKEMRKLRSLSIVTIEDPIEFVHKPKEGKTFLTDVVIQQQVGIDVPSFYDGIVASLRKHPNVILLGEIRGKDEMEEAIVAANTGHLVLGTLHTRNAIQTIERIVTLRQNVSKQEAYKEIASVMRAFIAQQLVPKIGGGFIPVCEILANTPYIADVIEKGANFMEMKEALDGKTRSPEIISLNCDLFNRWKRHEIDKETALAFSYNKVDLDLRMRKFSSLDKEEKEEEVFEEKGFV